jgi:hypothetical protein
VLMARSPPYLTRFIVQTQHIMGKSQHSMSSVNTNSGFRFMGGGTSSATGAGGLQKMLDLTRGQTIFYTADTERMRISSATCWWGGLQQVRRLNSIMVM